MGELQCLNVECGDASIVNTGTATFLIDCHNIGKYAHLLPWNKTLAGVFVTHQHRDHFSGLSYLYENGYRIEHLVYSPYERRYGDSSVEIDEWNEFRQLSMGFHRRGTKLHQPYRQNDLSEPWWKLHGLAFYIIGPDYAIATCQTREIHDACLVIKCAMGSRSCLFTGDASDSSLNHIARYTVGYCNDILHASHHGSINGADLDFVKGCNAMYTLISTMNGAHENVPHPTALRRYAEHTAHNIRRTDVDGSWKWAF